MTIAKLNGQSTSLSIGYEMNVTKLRLLDLNDEVFSNPFSRGIAYSISVNSTTQFNSTIIQFRPSLVILSSNSSITDSYRMRFVTFGVLGGIKISNKLLISGGVVYHNLISRISDFRGVRTNITALSSNNSFLNPTVEVGYEITKLVSCSISYVQFTKSLFNTGAVNQRNQIIGPIEVMPQYFAMGLNLKIWSQNSKTPKQI